MNRERFTETPIVVTTVTIQRRKHRKRRINKKWRKRYGCIEYDRQPKGLMYEIEGTLYMTREDFEKLKEIAKYQKNPQKIFAYAKEKE